MSKRGRRAAARGSAAHGPGPGPWRALLPIRFFFGGTFLYAGFDKLLDPRFFDPSSPASIQAQLAIFVRVSPIAPLVRLGQPLAVPIGLAIALLEIAIGLGALTGLAYRAAAWSGVLLSALFFLTASWTTRPFYYGPDLPYAIGWSALALAGHGGILVPTRLLRWASGDADATPRASVPPDPDSPPLRDRRTVLQAGVLGLFALVAASIAVPLRGAGARTIHDDDAGAEPSPSGASASPAIAPSPAASAAQATGTLVVARIADVAKTGARAFTIPFTAPAPLPAGDPGVIVQLTDGSYVAFDAVCTHAGCTVHWDRIDRVLVCPCHGASFDPAHRAAVIEGPTNEPLAALPIVVDPASGTIALRV